MLASIVLMPNAAHAWYVEGRVLCDTNNSGTIDAGDLPLAGITVTVAGVGFTFSATGTTDASGKFLIELSEFHSHYSMTINSNGAPVRSPAIVPAPFDWPAAGPAPVVDWLLDSTACIELKCWLTAGGAKFSNITGGTVAEKGPQHSFGGNVNPSCASEPGDGGQWNHVAHGLKLHFLGTAIQVVACGNVPGIPAGSESPVTPFNYIEYQGTGRLTGISGNKVDYGTVSFFARAEDRNEPGSTGAKDGAKIDRYFIRVVDGGGTVRLLLDTDGDPTTIDPITITGGNMQLHISSCPQ